MAHLYALFLNPEYLIDFLYSVFCAVAYELKFQSTYQGTERLQLVMST